MYTSTVLCQTRRQIHSFPETAQKINRDTVIEMHITINRKIHLLRLHLNSTLLDSISSSISCFFYTIVMLSFCIKVTHVDLFYGCAYCTKPSSWMRVSVKSLTRTPWIINAAIFRTKEQSLASVSTHSLTGWLSIHPQLHTDRLWTPWETVGCLMCNCCESEPPTRSVSHQTFTFARED